MENSELIKNFERIRDYMRQFYVYGFQSRSEIKPKSPRSYDNERRRIENWLGDAMSFRRTETGKQVFISMDSRALAHNPLYLGFKAKSFTDKDILQHFYILDCLNPGRELTLIQLLEEMEAYQYAFADAEALDISTLRKKLNEYEKLGLIQVRKQGKEYLYSRSGDEISLDTWADALDYFSEASALGVVGSFLLDRLPRQESKFRFKHHYLLHALDSQILCRLLDAIHRHRWVTLTLRKPGARKETPVMVLPCKIHISTQTGRQYLLGFSQGVRRFRFFRLDMIHVVKSAQEEPEWAEYQNRAKAFSQYLWGASVKERGTKDHLEMTIHASEAEPHIWQRLQREKRTGSVEKLDSQTFLFKADVYDAMEMLPWIRTFLGRISKLECSNPQVLRRFYQDLDAMAALYGGD